MEPIHIAVPKIIYESVEDILEAHSRRLAIDIAKTLGVNEKILLNEIRKDKIQTYLFEDNIDISDLCCKSYIKHKHVYMPCEQPILYKKDFCIEHMTKHILKENIKEAEILQVLCIDNITYYRNINNKVYDSEFEIIGVYNAIKKEIIKFIVED